MSIILKIFLRCELPLRKSFRHLHLTLDLLHFLKLKPPDYHVTLNLSLSLDI